MTEILDTIREYSVPLTVSRTDKETVQRGIVIPGTSVVSGIEGHMQPLSPRELRFVPEGMNTMQWHNIWTLSEILEDDYVTDGTAVVVRVVTVEPWKEGPFWHGQGVAVDDALVRTTTFNFTGTAGFETPALVLASAGTFTP